MINAKRLFGYLATGAMPEMTALDAALRRHAVLAAAMDAIDFAAHDKRYHGGQFDPKTMQCGMREALENGDLVDVLNAERQEQLDYERMRRELRDRNKERMEELRLRKEKRQEVARLRAENDEDFRRMQELKAKDPRQLTGEEFLHVYGRSNDTGAKRVDSALQNMFTPALKGSKGTVIGVAEGKKVMAHQYFHEEFVKSKNARWQRSKDRDGWTSKVRMMLDFQKVLATTHDSIVKPYVAHNNRHKAWMVGCGMQRSVVNWEGREWIAIFTCPSEDELLLYDIIRYKQINKTAD